MLGRTVRCAGEFDAANCHLLRSAVQQAAAGGPGYLVDLTAVSFVDSRVLEVLFAAAASGPAVVVRTGTLLAQILDTIGLDSVIEIRRVD